MITLKFCNGKKILCSINEQQLEAIVLTIKAFKKEKEPTAQELIENA